MSGTAFGDKVEFGGRRNSMAFWWVNHSGTYAEELGGGYIWCPPADVNGHERVTYNNLKKVMPGDVVFSYAESEIQAVGVVSARYRDAQRPAYAGGGANWADIGWLVPVEWNLLADPLAPKAHFGHLQPLLPGTGQHSPLTSNGTGAQNVYLAGISDAAAEALFALINATNSDARSAVEDAAANQEVLNSDIPETTKKQLVDARKGQGIFRDRVAKLEPTCRVSSTSDSRMLVASHIKPWAKGTNKERLDGNNGLMLAPHVDRLFDRFLLSFEDNGQLITAGPGVDALMRIWGLDPELKTPALRAGQLHYFAYHRQQLEVRVANGSWG